MEKGEGIWRYHHYYDETARDKREREPIAFCPYCLEDYHNASWHRGSAAKGAAKLDMDTQKWLSHHATLIRCRRARA
jgi:hypothetical protein